jgi:hypothetical protein
VHITVKREAPDGLSQIVWVFWLFVEFSATAQVRPNEYREEERPTKRHKFRTVRAWNRISWNRHDGTKTKWIDPPEDVREEVIRIIVSKIVFVDPS